MRCAKRLCIARSFSRRLAERHSRNVSALRAATDLDFDIFANAPPVVGVGELARPALQFRARRADHVAASRFVEPGDVLRAHHAAIHHPHAIRFAEAPLHAGDDLLDRGHIGRVAREDLVTQRHALARDHQRDVDLHAVGTVIARVAALRDLRVGHTLEVGARHIVEQQSRSRARRARPGASPGAARSPPCAATADRARGRAARRRPLQLFTPSRSSSAVVRYQRSATCSSLEGSHNRPITRIATTSAHATALATARHQLATQLIELQRLPQQPAQPHRTEAPRAFKANGFELDRNRGAGLVVVEQTALR